ncbi:MAG: hypothetical protein EBX92_06770 [Actinobacteria bacterium]|nr:hypothetical protein [Actinomycetota bacterium]
MSELSIVIINLVALAIAYLYIYPKYAGNDVKRLAWLDIAVGGLLLLVLAPFNWDSPNDYTFFVFDTNWWSFAILSYALLELPLFFLYVKARGLGAEYRDFLKSSGGFTEMASEKSVKKQLSDTKWDGLRTKGALQFLVIGTNTTVVLGTTFLFLVGDNDWTALLLLYIVALIIFWFLLRTAVRLIPDAPDSALDERMIQERNIVYRRAYQYLMGISGALAGALFGYAVGSDLANSGDGFNYEIKLTWPQINAIFWAVFGYAYMLPSLIMAWRESKRLERQS